MPLNENIDTPDFTYSLKRVKVTWRQLSRYKRIVQDLDYCLGLKINGYIIINACAGRLIEDVVIY